MRLLLCLKAVCVSLLAFQCLDGTVLCHRAVLAPLSPSLARALEGEAAPEAQGRENIEVYICVLFPTQNSILISPFTYRYHNYLYFMHA